jgi:hypothetical protein
MTLHLPRLRITLDPLIADAKRRMRVRRSLLTLMLLLVAGAAAGTALLLRPWGGGGGYPAAVQQEAKQVLRNGHPKILQIETVHDLGGNLLVIATLHGHFTFPSPNGPCGEPCQEAPSPTYVWLSFSQPPGMSGFEATTPSQIAAIDNAHGARPTFSIFPNSATTAIRCAIPRGNSSGTIAGSCSTAVEGTFNHVKEIRFHEAWSFAPSPLGYKHQKRDGGWIVALDRHQKVQSIRRFGDLPPQLWK